MELKPGYKQTEVGVIPEEWEVSTVGREFDVKLGKMLDAEKNVGVPKSYLGNRAVQWDRIDISELPTVRMTRVDRERFRLRKGDLLACEGGEVGRAAIWDAPIDECYYQKALHRLRPLRGFDPRLMVGLLRLWSDRGVLSNYVTQTSIAHLPREKFVKVPMPVPPLPEQRAIADALSDLDRLICELDQLIAKKCDLKQAAIQQLLTGQTRLPGFSGPWERRTLGALGNWFSGGTPAKTNELHWIGDIPWVSPKDMKVRRLNDAIDHVGRSAIGNGTRMLPRGAILVVVRGMILAHSAPVARAERHVAFNQDIKGLVVKNDIDSTFVLWWLVARESLLLSLTNEATHGTKRIPTDELMKLEMGVPALSEQSAISNAITDMDTEGTALERHRDKTRDLKQAMMQELLTGRTRLV